LYVSGITMLIMILLWTVHLTSLLVSSSTIIISNSTFNSSLYINAVVTDSNKSVLSVNSSSLGIMVNIIQNYTVWPGLIAWIML
jgi:hypothetical protein